MKARVILISAIVAVSAGFMSCGDKSKTDAGKTVNETEGLGETYVDTMTLRMEDFSRQTVCNGTLRAKEKCELAFPSQGVTMEIYVKEGQRVVKGQLIASQDKKEKLREVEKAEHELYRARVELTDKLIGLGYDTDMKDVPAEVMKRAEVTSGYYSAKYQLQTAKTALKECNLYAPVSGRVADVEAKAYQRNEKICTIIDDSQFDVEFKVLEAEMTSMEKGHHVKVTPFVEDSAVYVGTITEINPIVDKNGLVKVTARLSNRNSKLVEGMNVRVVVEKNAGKMFVVPKNAVVERDGYHVVFIYKDGKAVWTYVDVVHSNINSFAITGCKRKGTEIRQGDIVITSGNLNLADGTDVKIR